MSGKHSTETAADGHQHRPVQHRDGKPPWCAVCGLTAAGTTPESRFDRARVEQDVPTSSFESGPEVDPALTATFRRRPPGYTIDPTNIGRRFRA